MSHARYRFSDPQHLAVERMVCAASGEIVKGMFGDADDVPGDKRCALARALFGMLQRAFPLHHRPARIVVLRELREDAREIHLPVAERAKTSGAIYPILVAAIDTRSS